VSTMSCALPTATTRLSVVATGIHALQCGTIEDLRGELEIEPALA
jgi:hypothetical protein